jgi:hypothetical protein
VLYRLTMGWTITFRPDMVGDWGILFSCSEARRGHGVVRRMAELVDVDWNDL